MPKVSIIAAVSDNLVIGKLNKLPWHLPADLKHFKSLTTGAAVVMGKRTFESLPNGPLPNRKNIVVTSMLSDGVCEGFYEVESIEEALVLCDKEENIYIIGGGSVYKQTVQIADALHITWVHAQISGDAYFPELNFDEWREISREDFDSDDKNQYPYSFVSYVRK